MTHQYNYARDYEVYNPSGSKDKIKIEVSILPYYFFIISIKWLNMVLWY